MVSGVVFPPLLVVGVHFINPCKPSLFGYLVLYECRTIDNIQTNIGYITLNLLAKGVVFLSNIGIVWFIFHGAVFLVISVNIIGAMMSKECLQIFFNKVKSNKDIFRDALLYRELYIINILCNAVQLKFLGIVMGMAIGFLSIALNLLVMLNNRSSYEDMPILIVVFSLLIVVECVFVILIVFEGMVGVYKQSKRKLRICKRMVEKYESVKERKWLRRYWRSCNILKVKFGDGNFFEELTLLRCLDMSLNLTIQLLLLSRNN